MLGSHPELRVVIDLLGRELGGQQPGSCMAIPGLLDLFLVYVLRSWMAEGASGAWPGVLGDPVAAAVLRPLHADRSAPWTNARLATIARRVGYGTPYALSHAFSREFGTSPGRYRAQLGTELGT